jgi:GTP-binding protein
VGPGDISRRNNGVLISNGTGKALAYALFNLQERGRMIIEPGVDVYEGRSSASTAAPTT